MQESPTVADHILLFYRSLKIGKVPRGVKVMNPYRDPSVLKLVGAFYRKYYEDKNPRVPILGINPGRWGGGVTGVPFTDPIRLEATCHVANTLPKKPELSADFVYRVVEAFGGPHAFYGRFFLGAVCPLGFKQGGKNMNYYDDRRLQGAVGDFIVRSVREQAAICAHAKKAFCLGEGKNFAYLSALNNRLRLFEDIIPLPHPRFIMQYRRRKLDLYIERYLEQLKAE